jgi:hypothetical protein
MDSQKLGDYLDDEFFETPKSTSTQKQMWDKLDINKDDRNSKKSNKLLWLFFLGGVIVLLLFWRLWSSHTRNQEQNENLEIKYAELEKQYRTLNASHEKLAQQLAEQDLDPNATEKQQTSVVIDTQIVTKYIERTITAIDTVIVNVDPKIIYKDRLIRDTVFVDRIIETTPDQLSASINETENKVKRRGEELIFHFENTKVSGGNE